MTFKNWQQEITKGTLRPYVKQKGSDNRKNVRVKQSHTIEYKDIWYHGILWYIMIL